MASGPEHYARAEILIGRAADAYARSAEFGDEADRQSNFLLAMADSHALLASAAAHLAGRNSIPKQWAEVLEP